MEEKGQKNEREKMVKERREFPKEEFSGFRQQWECSKTRCVISPWPASLFIVAEVDLGFRKLA